MVVSEQPNQDERLTDADLVMIPPVRFIGGTFQRYKANGRQEDMSKSDPLADDRKRFQAAGGDPNDRIAFKRWLGGIFDIKVEVDDSLPPDVAILRNVKTGQEVRLEGLAVE